MNKTPRRIAVVLAALTAALLVPTAGVAAASAPTSAAVGPECPEPAGATVLVSVRVEVSPGQAIQVLYVDSSGQIAVLQPCVVTVPATAAG